MRKILFIIGNLYVGGSEKDCLSVLQNMDFNKFECHLFVIDDGNELLSMIPNEVIVHRLIYNKYIDDKNGIIDCFKDKKYFYILLKFLFGLLSYFGKNGKKTIRSIRKRVLFPKDTFDVSITFDSTCEKYMLKYINSRKKIGIQSSIHNEISIEKSNQLKQLDVVVAITEAQKKLYIDKVKINNDKITVINNSFDIDYIREKSNEYSIERKNKYIFSTCATLIPLKKIEIILNGLKRLTNIDYKLFIIGDNPDDDKYKNNLIEIAKPLGHKVEFLGSLVNPYPYLKESDIYLHTSETESWCRAISEALILGTPCLSTKTFGGLEQIKEGVNGELCEINNIDDFYEKLIYMINNLEKYKCDFKNNKEEIINKYISLF